jgi:hypothetical protein
VKGEGGSLSTDGQLVGSFLPRAFGF